MCHTIFINKANGDDIVTLTKQSFRNVIATRRILIVSTTYLLTIDIGDVGIKQRTQQQACRLSGMCLVYLDMLTQPCGTRSTPSPVILVNGCP